MRFTQEMWLNVAWGCVKREALNRLVWRRGSVRSSVGFSQLGAAGIVSSSSSTSSKEAYA